MRKTDLLILVCTSFYQFITAQDIASNIRLNQIGFFPEVPKIAVIAEDKNSDFFVKSVTHLKPCIINDNTYLYTANI
jgi:hypothetical protein